MPDEHRYDDMLDLPHFTSPDHPRMSMINRAAQFTPFAALTGYGDAINEAARLTDDKLDLSEDNRLEIGDKLNYLKSCLDARPEVSITYFQPDSKKQGGKYITTTGAIRRIREFEHEVVMENGTMIAFGDILEIAGNVFDELP